MKELKETRCLLWSLLLIFAVPVGFLVIVTVGYERPENIIQAEQPENSEEHEQQVEAVSFSADVLPILETECLECHGESPQDNDLSLHTYEAFVATVGEGEDSPLLAVLGALPHEEVSLSEEQVFLIRQWVREGAANN